MSLYEKWQEMAFNHESEQQEKTFWVKYLAEEKEIYVYILEHHTEKIQGTIKELAARFGMSDEFFCGFLDGINGSLIPPIDLEIVGAETEITLPIDFEKLYQEMVEYKADHLYSLPQWDLILTEQKRRELYKQQKKSKTIVKDGKIGRNDPCPCGSAKKYKKCCGA